MRADDPLQIPDKPVCGFGTGQNAIIWHRMPTVDWRCYDGAGESSLQSDHSCAFFNQALGLPNVVDHAAKDTVPCEIEHAGFEAHYESEAKNVPEAYKRDPNDPAFYCGQRYLIGMFLGNIGNSNAHSVAAYLKQSASGKADFVSKVKKLSCAYDDKKSESVTLSKDGTLTFYLSSALARSGNQFWVAAGLRKLFPEYKAWAAEHEPSI
ncbi:MAG TPA: hypothetical protein VGG74_35575 [Kofleriaceae bacterium]